MDGNYKKNNPSIRTGSISEFSKETERTVMKRVILTGGTGFVGSAIVQELLKHAVEVYAVVRPGYRENRRVSRLTGCDVRLIECSITEIWKLPDIMPERKFDAWYHFAWDGLFYEALTDYTTQIKNIQWTLDAVHTAAEMECKKFIGTGSVCQFELQVLAGKPVKGDKLRFYKTAKQSCEYMGKSLAADLNLTFIWPIITNIYGVGEVSPRLINSMIRNLLAGKHQALSDGDQLYDFIYITDAAKAFRLIGEKGRCDRQYTISQGQVQPLKHFLTAVRDVVSPGAKLGFGELAFNGIYLPKEAYDISALVEDTGFCVDISFTEGIRRTMEWIKKEGNQA